MTPVSKRYAERASKHRNPAARNLLETMERKRTNLAVSVDVTESKNFLAITDAVGPFVCMIKTHIDILSDFTPSIISELQALSSKHDFMIFEDRKFADIGEDPLWKVANVVHRLKSTGNTVVMQYSSGLYKIAQWAHITNAHTVPGPSVISGLAKVGIPLGRGLLLLAEMSTAGALTTGSYTNETVKMARENPDFVIGFIAQRRMERVGSTEEQQTMNDDEDFLILAPGVGMDVEGDSMGQQYRTPEDVVRNSGCDVIIVGRAIYGKDLSAIQDIRDRAQRFKEAGWLAYEQRLKP